MLGKISFPLLFILWSSRACIRYTESTLNNTIRYPPLDLTLKGDIQYIKFFAFTQQSRKSLVYYADDKADIIDPDKMTKILVHGWRNDEDSDMPQELKNSYLKFQDVNVVIVGWGKFATTINYGFSVDAVPLVAQAIARFMANNLKMDQPGIDAHLIGYSLGAHICAKVGLIYKFNNRQVYRITGLDPAAPLIKKGLTSKDAYFVDVIHTSAGVLGQWDPLAHADFYPNGGLVPQPNCTLMTPHCSHACAWKYYKKSIQMKKFYVAVRCNSFQNFLFGYCQGSTYMGEGVDVTARGTYYLSTSEYD